MPVRRPRPQIMAGQRPGRCHALRPGGWSAVNARRRSPGHSGQLPSGAGATEACGGPIVGPGSPPRHTVRGQPPRSPLVSSSPTMTITEGDQRPASPPVGNGNRTPNRRCWLTECRNRRQRADQPFRCATRAVHHGLRFLAPATPSDQKDQEAERAYLGRGLAVGPVRSTARARAARVVTPILWKMLRR
jgi:hypothetical protein